MTTFIVLVPCLALIAVFWHRSVCFEQRLGAQRALTAAMRQAFKARTDEAKAWADKADTAQASADAWQEYAQQLELEVNGHMASTLSAIRDLPETPYDQDR